MATRILSRKLPFLSKLLSNPEDTMSSRIFTTLATEDGYSISIVQQCRMLEVPLATNIVNQCLATPDDAVSIVHSGKKQLLERDFELLISSAISHPSVKHIHSNFRNYVMEKDLGWCSRSWSERYKVCSSNSEGTQPTHLCKQSVSPMQHLLLNTLMSLSSCICM